MPVTVIQPIPGDTGPGNGYAMKHRMPTDQDDGATETACGWIENLRATEPGELWWENLINALVDLSEPIVPILARHLSEEDRSFVIGIAAAMERITLSRQTLTG